ncbi:MAG: Holliday junction resolvase RuvX [Rickettsiales bacterium]
MIFQDKKEFLENLKRKNYKLIALDVGGKKIGIAFGNIETKIVSPYKTFLVNKQTQVTIIALTKEYEIDGIVIGMPLELTGKVGDAAKRIIKFAKELASKTDLPITYEDERFTTTIANDLLIQIGMNRKQRAKIDDHISAKVILDSFLSGL